jgi:hypothetical protein
MVRFMASPTLLDQPKKSRDKHWLFWGVGQMYLVNTSELSLRVLIYIFPSVAEMYNKTIKMWKELMNARVCEREVVGTCIADARLEKLL